MLSGQIMRSLENTFSHLASVVACSCPCLPAHIHISMYTYHSVVVFVQLVLVRLTSVTSNTPRKHSQWSSGSYSLPTPLLQCYLSARVLCIHWAWAPQLCIWEGVVFCRGLHLWQREVSLIWTNLPGETLEKLSFSYIAISSFFLPMFSYLGQ